jgi:hypothetical protein
MKSLGVVEPFGPGFGNTCLHICTWSLTRKKYTFSCLAVLPNCSKDPPNQDTLSSLSGVLEIFTPHLVRAAEDFLHQVHVKGELAKRYILLLHSFVYSVSLILLHSHMSVKPKADSLIFSTDCIEISPEFENSCDPMNNYIIINPANKACVIHNIISMFYLKISQPEDEIRTRIFSVTRLRMR